MGGLGPSGPSLGGPGAGGGVEHEIGRRSLWLVQVTGRWPGRDQERGNVDGRVVLGVGGGVVIRGVVGAVLVSAAAWMVMRALGVAGPDAGLYSELLRDGAGLVMDAVRWLLGAVQYPQRAVLVVAAVAGFMLGAKSG